MDQFPTFTTAGGKAVSVSAAAVLEAKRKMDLYLGEDEDFDSPPESPVLKRNNFQEDNVKANGSNTTLATPALASISAPSDTPVSRDKTVSLSVEEAQDVAEISRIFMEEDFNFDDGDEWSDSKAMESSSASITLDASKQQNVESKDIRQSISQYNPSPKIEDQRQNRLGVKRRLLDEGTSASHPPATPSPGASKRGRFSKSKFVPPRRIDSK